MEQDDEVQDYLHLSADFLQSARRDVDEGRFAPARMSMHQALELGLKAALMAKTGTAGEDWATHNVHGQFARHFRGRVEDAVLSRVSRLLQEYGKSRYPDWPSPPEREMREDLRLVEELVEETLPRLIQEVRS